MSITAAEQEKIEWLKSFLPSDLYAKVHTHLPKDDKELTNDIIKKHFGGEIRCHLKELVLLEKLMKFIGATSISLTEKDGADSLLETAKIPISHYSGKNYAIVYDVQYSRATLDRWSSHNGFDGIDWEKSDFLDLTSTLVEAFLKKAKVMAFKIAIKKWEEQNIEELNAMRDEGARTILEAQDLLTTFDDYDHAYGSLSKK